MFHHYLIIAFRNLLRNKFQSLFTIVGLSVAFFCFGICAYFVHGWLTIDDYYANRDRTIELRQEENVMGILEEQFDKVIQHFPEEIEAICIFSKGEDRVYKYRDVELDPFPVINCDTTLRHIFAPRLLAGSWIAAETMPNSMLLTERYAIQLFGSPEEAIGQQITQWVRIDPYGTDGDNEIKKRNFTVQAVVENLPYNNSIDAFCDLGAWIMNDEGGLQTRGGYIYTNRILLREGTDFDLFAKRLKEAHIKHSEHTFDHGVPYVRYIEAYWPGDIDTLFGSHTQFIVALALILLPGVLILLSALSNFFHLLISSIMLRRREYALRRAHGAHTLDLWKMLSVQIVVTMLLVGGGSMLIIQLCTSMLQFNENGRLIAMLDTNELLRQSAQHLAILLLIGFVVAWLAVARFRHDSLQESLKTSTGHRPGRHVMRNVLMGLQMSIGFLFLILLTALILFVRDMEKSYLPWLSDKEKQTIIEVPCDYKDMKKTRSLKSDVEAIPSVTELLLDSWGGQLLSHGYKQIPALNPAGDTIQTNEVVLVKDYLNFVHVPLLEGRLPETPNEIVVDPLFIQQHHLGVGEQIDVLIYLCKSWTSTDGKFPNMTDGVVRFTIVGVIDNLLAKSRIHNNGVWRKMNCYYKFFEDQFDTSNKLVVKCHPDKVDETRRALNDIMHRHGIWPQDRVEKMPTLNESLIKYNKPIYQLIDLCWLFAAIAIVITLLSVYSAITMDTTARRKEMVIRKINGAKAHHIALWFGRLYILLLGVSAAITFPLTYILFLCINTGERFIGGDTAAYALLFYFAILLCMTLFVALTIGVQIWRIARIQPAQIVKEE